MVVGACHGIWSAARSCLRNADILHNQTQSYVRSKKDEEAREPRGVNRPNPSQSEAERFPVRLDEMRHIEQGLDAQIMSCLIWLPVLTWKAFRGIEVTSIRRCTHRKAPLQIG